LWLAVSTLDGRANVLVFAVPGLLGGVWLRRPLLVGAVLAAQSALTELFQALIGTGSCQPSDWIANTTGAAIGAAAAWAVITVSGRFTTPRP
jgi:VanZ family protein